MVHRGAWVGQDASPRRHDVRSGLGGLWKWAESLRGQVFWVLKPLLGLAPMAA